MIGRPLPEQPWAGVQEIAAERPDWLLSLEPQARPHRELIAAVGYYLARATQIGNPAPLVADLRARMQSPRPGDLVFAELSEPRRRGQQDPEKAFGILLAGPRLEWWHSDERWMSPDDDMVGGSLAAAAMDGWKWDGDPLLNPRRPVAPDVCYVQYGPHAADVERWIQVEFRALPMTHDSWLTAAGTVVAV